MVIKCKEIHKFQFINSDAVCANDSEDKSAGYMRRIEDKNELLVSFITSIGIAE